MREKSIESVVENREEQEVVPTPGQTLTSRDLLGIIRGDLEGHYWSRIDSGEIVSEGTLKAGDKEAFNYFSRSLLSQSVHHDCQYGGQITSEQARVLYRAKLWEVWQRLYK